MYSSAKSQFQSKVSDSHNSAPSDEPRSSTIKHWDIWTSYSRIGTLAARNMHCSIRCWTKFNRSYAHQRSTHTKSSAALKDWAVILSSLQLKSHKPYHHLHRTMTLECFWKDISSLLMPTVSLSAAGYLYFRAFFALSHRFELRTTRARAFKKTFSAKLLRTTPVDFCPIGPYPL